MKGLLLLVPALILSSVVSAETVKVSPDLVLSSITADWNEDGFQDRAVLIDDEEGSTELALYLSNGGTGQRDLVAFLPKFAWKGLAWGTQPSLVLAGNGSLQVNSENSAIGRDRWSQTVTLSYRDGEWLVTGYTLTTYDTLDPDNATSCDVNILTGKAVKNGKNLKTAARRVSVFDWNEESKPAVCE